MLWKIPKFFLFSIILLILLSGCINSPVPIPTPPSTRSEIPTNVLYSIHSIKDLQQWIWDNYNYVKDEDWTGYRDYYLTPAEMFMSRIKIGNRIVEKPVLIGDCEDYAGLAAYLLWKCFDCQSYIAIITLTPYLAHAIAYGISPDGNCIVVNAPLVNIQYATINDYLSDYYPGKKISRLFKLENYLNSLYLQGHHQYWDEEI